MKMCVCASLMPGTTVRPPRSMRRVWSRASAVTDAVSPTAVMRSPAIATAAAHGCAAFAVKTLPLTRIVSGPVAVAHALRHTITITPHALLTIDR